MLNEQEEGLLESILRSANRHIGRCLQDLEDANCPGVYRGAVRREMQWQRDDALAIIAEWLDANANASGQRS
jgi:hypothetical protein